MNNNLKLENNEIAAHVDTSVANVHPVLRYKCKYNQYEFGIGNKFDTYTYNNALICNKLQQILFKAVNNPNYWTPGSTANECIDKLFNDNSIPQIVIEDIRTSFHKQCKSYEPKVV
jgi:hypothetical protein